MGIASKVTVAIGIALVLWAAAWAQEEMVTVDSSVFADPQRAASVFVHDEHNEVAEIEDCAVCHHLYEDGRLVEGESSEDQRCADCHQEKSRGPMPTLMRAFHTNCKGCHLDKESGPVMCGECHRRDTPPQES